MANIRPKDTPRVTSVTAGDSIMLDGATTRSIEVKDLFPPGGNVYYASKYGVVANGTTDNAVPLQMMFLDAALTGGTIILPAGKILSTERITCTLTGANALSIIGQGTDVTVLYWPNADGGLKINYTTSGNVVHVRDLTFTTGIISGGTGLELTQTDSLKAFPETTIKNVSFRGDPNVGDVSSQHWTVGVFIDNVSGVVMDTITVWGAGDPASSGIRIHGAASPGGALTHKISKSFFGHVGYGVKVDGFEQTLMIDKTSFIFNYYGLYTQTGGDVYFTDNVLSTTVGGVYLADASLALSVIGCLFENFGGDSIYVNDTRGVRLIGNLMGDPRGVTAGTRGIVLDGTSSYGAITGNNTGFLSLAVSLSAGTSHNDLKGNTYVSNTADVSDAGTANLLSAQFDKTITLKGANTVGLDFTEATSMVQAARFPNESTLAWEDSGGTLRPVLNVGTNIIFGNSAWSVFIDTPNIIPLADNTTSLGVVGGRWASVHTMLNKLYGSTSGVITEQAQAAAGTYNWNLPTSAGSAGQPLLSGGGGSTAMTFGTLGAPVGGTGQTSYAVGDLLYAPTTSTVGKLADVATGNALISGGVGVAPSYGKVGLTTHVSGTLPVANGGTGQTTGAMVKIVVQKFTASGTYTPTTGLLYATIECVGGGGGGAGVANSTAGQQAGGGGGGAGSYSRKTASAATVGASQTITIGALGAGGAAGANNGSAGGDTSVGTLCVGKGGSGGNTAGPSGAGGVAGTGDITGVGQAGGVSSTTTVVTFFALSGYGGTASPFGGGGAATQGNSTGIAATGNGGGGGGGMSYNAGGAAAGGNGSAGLVVVTEYVNQ